VFIIQLQPKIYDFIMLTVRFLFISYVCSQIPVLLICCIEYNVIGLKECIKHRRVLLCCSVCIAALVTPPDIGSQIAAWLPLYLVIELSLFYALIRRNYDSAAAAAMTCNSLRRLRKPPYDTEPKRTLYPQASSR
jgi:Sec-independent protein secretion pathway component TatC